MQRDLKSYIRFFLCLKLARVNRLHDQAIFLSVVLCKILICVLYLCVK